MQAQTLTPSSIFGHHIRYVVPIFQRPYVWTEEDQWRPLWEDICVVADQILAPQASNFYGSTEVAPHFLGAIVLDGQSTPSGYVTVRHVIDGQQRLTTLQLLLDAVQLVAERHGDERDAHALRVLVLNSPEIAQHDYETFKVWPTNHDQPAFQEAMSTKTLIADEFRNHAIAKAHSFFVDAAMLWATTEVEPSEVSTRINALVRTLRDHLKLVVIDLERGDNAQVIFETLNHRGVPLLAADLIKNFVFQAAEAQGAQVQELYESHWKRFDEPYWREPVRQGRLFRPRVDVFMNHWLTMKLQYEVPADRIFTEFRSLVVRENIAASSALAEISNDAELYVHAQTAPYSTAVGQFQYRVIRALDSSVVTPVLLFLLRARELGTDTQQFEKALRCVESWVVRRALLQATSKDLNRLVVDLLRSLASADQVRLGDATETFLGEQSSDSRLWPTNEMLAEALVVHPTYKLRKPRLRMLLEALEDQSRGRLSEGESCPRNLSIEHVMPQSWQENWAPDASEDETEERNRLLHTLGNLTLVSGRLNPALSNRPWTTDKNGNRSKRDYLLENSNLKLNAEIAAKNPEAWTTTDIRNRSNVLIDRICEIWPRPERGSSRATNTLLAIDPEQQSSETDDGEGVDGSSPVVDHSGKYRLLWDWLGKQSPERICVSFQQLEVILGMDLPPAARQYVQHWHGYEGSAVARAIRDAGWRASNVDLSAESVEFIPLDS